ncbi:hypothetical protein F1_00044 [Ralstonia phage Heva]|uniref:Uncharacterized protein n=1 Tax=Ralstonia phage Heva TaxID=2759730 RepID=A0A7G5BAT4_9CAUD|nr:hypothetical protein KMC48_gp46 [Ralstonia phage Heva]QMV32844.1 hypothetical protein D1_00018 [Ralstonia phage Dimitile]QMV33407.1 hypothetical protein F1_00044 [Ralstonia phage Heva]
MRPFDFNQFAAGAPAIMPDGRKVRFVHFYPGLDVPYPVAVHIEGAAGLTSISANGELPYAGKQLGMAPPVKRTVWVNLYREDSGRIVASRETHASEDAATYDRLSSDYVGAFPIEIEE